MEEVQELRRGAACPGGGTGAEVRLQTEEIVRQMLKERVGGLRVTWETGEPTSLPDRRASPVQLTARKSCLGWHGVVEARKASRGQGRTEGLARSFETLCGHGKEVSVLQGRALGKVMFMVMVT